MHSPDVAYRIYTKSNPRFLEEAIRDLNAIISNPATPVEDTIAAAKKLITTETLLRTQRAKLAKRIETT